MLRKESRLEELPIEVISKEIFPFLNFKEIFNLSIVNKKLKHLFQENKYIFKTIFFFKKNKNNSEEYDEEESDSDSNYSLEKKIILGTYAQMLREIQVTHRDRVEKNERISSLTETLECYENFARCYSAENSCNKEKAVLLSGTPPGIITFLSLCFQIGSLPGVSPGCMCGLNLLLGAAACLTTGVITLGICEYSHGFFEQKVKDTQNEINTLKKEVKKPIAYFMK